MESIIPIKIVKIEDGCHLFVKVVFNSKTKGILIIDTGASKTVFDISLLKDIVNDVYSHEDIKSAGIEANMIESKLGSIDTFKIGKLKIKDYKVVLLNLDNINQLYENIYKIKIWGLIGGDFLAKYKAVINYENKHLIIKH